MQILPFQAANLNELSSLQPPDWPDLKLSFQYYLLNISFCSPIKIAVNNQLIGVGTTILHNDVAWLAHIVVHPDFRNQGIGRIITTTLIESLKKYSCKTISLVATDLSKPVYEKIGFEIVGEYVFLKNDEQERGLEISDNIKKTEQKFFNSVLQLDSNVSGEDRSNQLIQYLSNSFIYCEKNNVEGFYLPELGDGLIIAENLAAGIELMKLRNKTHNIASLSNENEMALKFLKKNKFKEFRTAKRMSMGTGINWEPKMIYLFHN